MSLFFHTLPKVSSPQYLKGEKAIASNRFAALSWSLGAGFATELARSKPKDSVAVVVFYGIAGGKYDNANAAFLGHFAAMDEWGTNSARKDAFEDRLLAGDLSFTFYTYLDTTHWFFEEDRKDAYVSEASALAWQRTLNFLDEQLR